MPPEQLPIPNASLRNVRGLSSNPVSEPGHPLLGGWLASADDERSTDLLHAAPQGFIAGSPLQPVSFHPGRGRHPGLDHSCATIFRRAHELGRREAWGRGGLGQLGLVHGVALDAHDFSTPLSYRNNLVIVSSMDMKNNMFKDTPIFLLFFRVFW